VSDGDAGRLDAAHDGAEPARDGAESAQVSVELSVDLDALEDDTTLERLSVGVLEVRAPNDRGDLRVEVGRAFELATGPSEIMLASAAPAVYGGVEVDLGPGAWGPALVLRVQEPERTIELTLDGPLTLTGRCDSPVALDPGRQLALRVQLDAASIADFLREAPLPEPSGGVIRVDARSAPSLIPDILERLGDLRSECDESDVDSP